MTIKTDVPIVMGTIVPSGVPSVRELIADTLDLDVSEVTPALALHDVPEWSSLDHVTLMLALETHLQTRIDGPLTAQLTSVKAIEAWAAGETIEQAEPDDRSKIGPGMYRGLDGVHFDTTAITSIDGQAGKLLIRGYSIEDLADHADLADVAHLVLYGTKPTGRERSWITTRLLAPPPLPEGFETQFDSWNDHHPMVALRTAISLLGRSDPEGRVLSSKTAVDHGLDLTAWSMELLSRHLAARLRPEERTDRSIMAVDTVADEATRWPIAARFLTRCFGTAPSPIEAEALDLVWRLLADHGSNASAFAARVTVAAGTDVAAAMVSGLSTFAGAIHGGAVEGVVVALREIGGPAEATDWVERRRANRQPIMGYGHRVYKVADPRSVPLRVMAERLADHRGERWPLDTMAAVENVMARYEHAGLGMNVDSYASVLFHLLGIPDDYHTALYAAARMIGWTAQVAEQVEANVLIRPRLAYDGPAQRPWTANALVGSECIR